MSKVILLMGAPTFRSLQWDEDKLLNTPISPFHGPDSHPQEAWPFPDDHPLKWRLLQQIPAKEQAHDDIELEPNRDTISFTTEGLTDTAGKYSVLSQFYDHSFAVHEASEVSAPMSFLQYSPLQESGLWVDSTMTSSASTSSSKQNSSRQPSFISIQGQVCDLQDIPSASYLRSIVPQTVTVNLIVGIITIHPPRRVITRQWKQEVNIVEMVVGDETRSGFGVTFWVPPESGRTDNGSSNNDGLGRSLDGLRPRDIVLLRMVGLSSFRERVYGQSLRKGVTQIDLLHHQRVDATDAGGIYGLRRLLDTGRDREDPVVVKARRVREWIQRFVLAPEPAGGDEAGGMRRMKRGQTLPPDTPEMV
ncbi:uncharacterized protein EURHEDRAFT_415618 [Aspergillus ruber CBS 135680]|uniref:Uncharacterized protein n=1 Tax=Aspergillus ruber (strain CBS 135680) TaxID=1388766 RepID=A0A017S5T1_ASPRC|nr:uncharacterized protein EURHEDRAFT_415618 [Aspergillus ruber CBS 135680]EYE92196.1 hypothetical protein EURHEDRAFT_415618 [Aspergillus ruber CBS 135680]